MTASRKARATTAKLGLGEDTIMRATPRLQDDGIYWLDWSYQPEDGSKVIRKRSKGATVGEVRLRAREKLDDLKAGVGSTWKRSDDIADYIEKVSKPAIGRANLAEQSHKQYALAMKLLLGDCSDHKHKRDLRRHSIGSAIRFKALEDLLTEIGELHGHERARQARNVLTKYVMNRLIRDELIDGNPIAGISLVDLIGVQRGERVRGGKALTRTEYESVLEYLLALDPAEGVVRRQGRWSREHLINKRRNAIDQALLQAASGLRSTESNLLVWDRHIGVKDDGTMYINVTKDVAKGGIPRVSLVLDQRVTERMLKRRKQAKSLNEYVIGSPADPLKPWDRDNRNKAARALYLEVAKEVKIDVFLNERSHMWRTTLHTMYAGKVPVAVLDAQFGNSEEVRSKHYTDVSDMSSLAEAAQIGKAG